MSTIKLRFCVQLLGIINAYACIRILISSDTERKCLERDRDNWYVTSLATGCTSSSNIREQFYLDGNLWQWYWESVKEGHVLTGAISNTLTRSKLFFLDGNAKFSIEKTNFNFKLISDNRDPVKREWQIQLNSDPSKCLFLESTTTYATNGLVTNKEFKFIDCTIYLTLFRFEQFYPQ